MQSERKLRKINSDLIELGQRDAQLRQQGWVDPSAGSDEHLVPATAALIGVGRVDVPAVVGQQHDVLQTCEVLHVLLQANRGILK